MPPYPPTFERALRFVPIHNGRGGRSSFPAAGHPGCKTPSRAATCTYNTFSTQSPAGPPGRRPAHCDDGGTGFCRLIRSSEAMQRRKQWQGAAAAWLVWLLTLTGEQHAHSHGNLLASFAGRARVSEADDVITGSRPAWFTRPCSRVDSQRPWLQLAEPAQPARLCCSPCADPTAGPS